MNTVIDKAERMTLQPGQEDFRNGGGNSDSEQAIIIELKKFVYEVMKTHLKKHYTFYVEHGTEYDMHGIQSQPGLNDLMRDIDILFGNLLGEREAKTVEFGANGGGKKAKASNKVLIGPRGGKYVIRNGIKIYLQKKKRR